jgi:hypothetical protein
MMIEDSSNPLEEDPARSSISSKVGRYAGLAVFGGAEAVEDDLIEGAESELIRKKYISEETLAKLKTDYSKFSAAWDEIQNIQDTTGLSLADEVLFKNYITDHENKVSFELKNMMWKMVDQHHHLEKFENKHSLITKGIMDLGIQAPVATADDPSYWSKSTPIDSATGQQANAVAPITVFGLIGAGISIKNNIDNVITAKANKINELSEYDYLTGDTEKNPATNIRIFDLNNEKLEWENQKLRYADV